MNTSAPAPHPVGEPPGALLVCPRGMAPARRTAASDDARDWSLGAVLAECPIDPRTSLLVVRADAGLAAALDLRRRLRGLRLAGHTTLLVDLEGADTVSHAILAALMQAKRQRAEEVLVAEPDDELGDALVELAQTDGRRGLVLDRDRLAGLLSITDISRLLELRRLRPDGR